MGQRIPLPCSCPLSFPILLLSCPHIPSIFLHPSNLFHFPRPLPALKHEINGHSYFAHLEKGVGFVADSGEEKKEDEDQFVIAALPSRRQQARTLTDAVLLVSFMCVMVRRVASMFASAIASRRESSSPLLGRDQAKEFNQFLMWRDKIS